MRQQEANQFDKGLSLDTNAIAMDNHTLSGALNATMITMNGNELVLQNDMGNAKVESAYLPSGYVPVGMQEFGGIVYVASYNPFEKTSQIGCFPSPERNVSGSETGGAHPSLPNLLASSNGVKTTTSARVQLIPGPVRSGDKFVIQCADKSELLTGINSDLLEFKVLSLGEDGNGVDITKDIHNPSGATLGFLHDMSTPQDSDFSTYKYKAPGSIWLQESLVLPAYITVSITSTETQTDGIVRVQFDAEAFDSEGNPWASSHPANAAVLGFDYSVSVGSGNPVNANYIEVRRGVGNILNYTIMPQYTFGKIALLKQTGNVAVDLLGSGNVDIPSVRYYNDSLNDQFTLEYTINAYVENSKHHIDTVNLEFFDFADCTVSEGTGASRTITFPTPDSDGYPHIQLSNSNVFGSYTVIIPYSSSTEGSNAKLFKGHMYIARIAAKRTTEGTPVTEKMYYSKWFALITSPLTNEVYMNNPTDGMFEVTDPYIFKLDWDINWTEKNLGESYTDTQPTDLNTGTPMPMTISQEELIRLQTVREGEIMLKYSAEVEVNLFDGSFPFDLETSTAVSIPEDVENHTTFTTNIETTGGYRAYVDLITSEENTPVLNSWNAGEEYDNKVWSAVNNGITDDVTVNEDGTLERTLHYRLKSQFAANPTEPLTYTGSDIPALVPLQTLRTQDYDDVSQMVGCEVLTKSNGNQFTSMIPMNWWVWGTKQGKKRNDRVRQMAFMQAENDYFASNNKGSGDSGISGPIPTSEENLTEYGQYLFNTTTTNATWKFYSTVTMDYLHNDLKMYPYLFFWQGCNDDSCTFHKGNTRTKNYSIPVMLDASGEMFLIGQYSQGVGNGEILYDIVKCLSRIYVYQQGQSVSYSYYKAKDSLADYIYTNNYTAKIESQYKATPTVVFKCGDNVYEGGEYTLAQGSGTIYLPEFQLKETSKSGTENKTFVTYVSAPDQLSKNLEYLDAEPTLGNVAIIKDSDSPAIVGNATRITSGSEDGIEPFDISHPYFAFSGSGGSTKLCDCMKSLPSSAVNEFGYGIAKALNDRYLRVIYSSENERNILVVNRSTINNVANVTSQEKIGKVEENSKITNLSGIASRHLLNLQLFKGENNRVKNMTLTRT